MSGVISRTGHGASHPRLGRQAGLDRAVLIGIVEDDMCVGTTKPEAVHACTPKGFHGPWHRLEREGEFPILQEQLWIQLFETDQSRQNGVFQTQRRLDHTGKTSHSFRMTYIGLDAPYVQWVVMATSRTEAGTNG